VRDERRRLTDCTRDCERMPVCIVCGRRKKPRGRSAPLETTYCDDDCSGYYLHEMPGHLWPGEWEDENAS